MPWTRYPIPLTAGVFSRFLKIVWIWVWSGLRPTLTRVTGSAGLVTWDFLAGSGHPLLRDWTLIALGEFQTGQPFTVNTSLDQNFDGNLTDRLDSVDGLSTNPQEPASIRLGQGVDPSSLVATRGEQGQIGRNTFQAQGIATIDLALSRGFSLAEETTLEVRMEVFNLLNRTHFGIPVRILESPGLGRSFDTQVRSRSLRLALKLSF